MRVARIKALLSMRRKHRRSSDRDARLARAVIDSLERRVLLAANIIQVQVALDEDNMGNAFVNSLRWAIGQANATPGSTIEFTGLTPVNAPIVLNADLSAAPITAAGTTIDGLDSPQGRVVIDGAAEYDGLDIQAANVTIEGLAFVNLGKFTSPPYEPSPPPPPGNALTLDTGSSDDLIINNYFGMTGFPTIDSSIGVANENNPVDIDITNGSTGDTIGGTDASDRNIIGAATYSSTERTVGIGVDIEDPMAMGTADNVVEGNYIGVDNTGEAALANTVGVELQDVAGNTIQSNLIGDNTTEGILTIDP